MTDRILSRHGNVIAADFRTRPASHDLAITIESTVLYRDDRVMFTRATCSVGGVPVPAFTQHFMADLATGRIVHL